MATTHSKDFKAIARLRLAEAQSLLDSGHWAGAYYLVGYAVECGLKASIARQFRASTFPDVKLVREVHTHDLDKLVGLAGLRANLNAALKADADLDVNWTTVKDWSEQARYEDWSESDARDMFSAVCDRRHGVMKWVRSIW
ncbi:HEPN domain-containing protein [Gordonia terrae]